VKIGMKTSAITLGNYDVAAIMAFELIFLTIWLATLRDIAQTSLVLIACLAAGAQIFWHWRLVRTRSREGCFTAFRQHHWLGLTLFLSIALSYARPAAT
jgi:4-hydroxybenzoate polyprenyltransferase